MTPHNNLSGKISVEGLHRLRLRGNTRLTPLWSYVRAARQSQRDDPQKCASGNFLAVLFLFLCLGATNSPEADFFPGINPPIFYNQPYPSNHVYATVPPKLSTNNLPLFKYPRGAETNVWYLQSRVSMSQGWVTIAGPFYGTNGSSLAVTNQYVPVMQFRMKKL